MTTPAPRENPALFGHAAAEKTMLAARASARLHHAWLITGPEGVGKATLAYRFARCLLAGGAAGLDLPPQHQVFRRVAAGTHADLLTVEREWDDKKKRMKKSIAAETAREIPGFLHLTPAEGGWRVVIVDGAEDLNIQSANALLKVLEEPPSRAVLMLVCSAPGRLLPTIRSRCRHLKLPPLDGPSMHKTLGHYLPAMPEQDRAELAALADGAPGRALALAEEGGVKIARMAGEILGDAPDFSLLRAYEIADSLRDQAPFEIFMGLLRRGIIGAVTGHQRGRASPAQTRLAVQKPPHRWAEITSRLTELTDETEKFNLDRRQAVVAGLALLKAA